MPPLDGLDESQRAAGSADGHSLVLAGPGSGKTRLLSAKAQYLLECNNVGVLAAVSFTRDSASELVVRIGPQYQDRVQAGTFHALALQQAGRSRGRILDESGRIHYIVDALERTGIDMPLDYAITTIDRFKATMAPPPSEGEEAEVFRAYQSALSKHGLIDFQDILLNSVKGMRAGEIKPVPAKWLLVDEAQDMDDVQYAWIMCHVKAGAEVTLVADDDQSIYGWRHALGYAGLVRFERDTQARRFVLNANYRSEPRIVAGSLSVIANNAERFDKRIQPKRRRTEAEAAVRVRAYDSQYTEAEAVAEALRSAPAGWGVLSRTNRRLDLVELSCGAIGVPVIRLGGKSFWDRAPAAAFLAFLDDLVKQDLRSGVTRLASFVDGVTREDLERLHDADKPTHTALRELVKHAPEWSRLAAQAKRADLALRAIALWGDKYLQKKPMSVFRPAMRHVTRLNGSVAQRVAYIRRAKKKTADPDAERPVLASLHASKGLEWPQVWLVGCEDGHMPHVDAPLDEERRLFYVGMTRAKDGLFISHSLEDAVASRFIAEIGQ